MPTVLRHGPYRFFFYASDRAEPPHVHVRRDEDEAKYWLTPIRLAWVIGFKRHDLNRIRKIIEERDAEILEAWHDYFGR